MPEEGDCGETDMQQPKSGESGCGNLDTLTGERRNRDRRAADIWQEGEGHTGRKVVNI